LMLMVLAGYFTMAILILVISMGGGHPGPLNDTVKISKGRVAAFVISMFILVVSIPPLWDILGIF
ncbi:MAG: hypothetical protein ACFFDM_05700, partial [Candidatus Thorarchaeota archaeon]